MERRDVIKTMSLALGYSLTPAALTGLMSSCSKEAKVNWTPQFFSVKEAYAVEEISEVIFPKSDIPGAKDVGAHVFVDRYLADVFKEEKQAIIKKGAGLWLNQFETRLGKPLGEAEAADFEWDIQLFFDLDQSAYESVREMMNQEDSGTASDEYYIYHFLSEVRNLARIGFYASEHIGEKVLSYLPVPGKYEGCIPLEQVGNAWSLG